MKSTMMMLAVVIKVCEAGFSGMVGGGGVTCSTGTTKGLGVEVESTFPERFGCTYVGIGWRFLSDGNVAGAIFIGKVNCLTSSFAGNRTLIKESLEEEHTEDCYRIHPSWLHNPKHHFLIHPSMSRSTDHNSLLIRRQ